MAEDTKKENMAEEGASWWNSWGQGWVDAVKEKSAATLEMVKKDLNEFVDVIQGDTSVVMSETATKLENDTQQSNSSTAAVKKGLSSLLHTVSEMMTVEPDDSNEEAITLSQSFVSGTYSRKEEKLHAIRTDPGTYCNEPEGMFNDWLQVFNLEDHKAEMSELLIENSNIRAIYTQLVPTVVGHTTFWQRYYFQLFLLEAEERRREDVLARSSKDDDQDGGWDDDDDLDQGLVIPEKVQQKVDLSVSTNTLVSEENENETENNKNNKKEVVIEQNEDIDKCNDAIDKSDVAIDKNEHSIDENNEIDNEALDIKGNTAAQEIDNFNNDLVNSETDLSEIIETTERDNGDQTYADDNIEQTKTGENAQNDEEFSSSPSNKTLEQKQIIEARNESMDASSVGSWVSIDDDIKVKKTSGEQHIKDATDKSSSNSSGSAVLVNKEEVDDEFDIEIDDDDEEIEKLVTDIKNKSLIQGTGEEEEDDDWENWE